MTISLTWATRRIPAIYLIGALASIIAAAGVLVAASNFLDLGIIGMGAAIAIVPIAVGIGWIERIQDKGTPMMVGGLSVMVTSLLAALLAGGRYYTQTGISSLNFYLIGSHAAASPPGGLASRKAELDPWSHGRRAAKRAGVVHRDPRGVGCQTRRRIPRQTELCGRIPPAMKLFYAALIVLIAFVGRHRLVVPGLPGSA